MTKKTTIDKEFEKQQFPFNFNGLQRFTKNFNQYRSFHPISFIFRLGDLCTYFWSWSIPVSVQGSFLQAAMCVKWRLQNFNMAILKGVICLGFSIIEEIYQNCNFGCFCLVSFLFSPHVVHTRIFVLRSQIFFVFASIFQHN